MGKERVEAVETVAERLFAAEAAIDQALAAAAELSASMPQARQQAHLSGIVGQEAMECAAASITSLLQARNQMIAAHGALDRVKTEIGLRTHAFGGGMIKPPPSAQLQLVDREAA